MIKTWIARVVTLGIVAVLADAALASIHGSLTVLAAVAGAAALALMMLALVWPRPWIAAAFAVFMLASAFAVGTRAGVTNGPALTGLNPTDAAAATFAAMIVAAAIAAALVLASAPARIIVLVIAAYPLITTLASIEHGGLAAAFASAPLAWTRGSYFAAEVFVPLAAVAALVYAGRQFVRRRGANGAAGIVLTLALVAATQLGGYAAGVAGLPTIVAFERIPNAQASANVIGRTPSGEQASSSATGEPLIAADVAQSSAATGTLFVPKGSDDVPPEVSAAAASGAEDPQHALEAVAGLSDDLYPGALAGSVGALRGGSANSVDKALLLRDLVRAGTPGIETAFAQCTLSAAESDALVTQARSIKSPRTILLQNAGDAANGATDPVTRATLQRWAQTWKTLAEQTQDEGRKLTGELHTAGLALPPGDPTPDRLRALAAQHIWLRARVHGSWVDLDPTIEPAASGKTRCTAQAQTTKLPDDLYDSLDVRIAVETVGRGAPQRSVIFDRSVRTADIGDRDVSFMFAEPLGMGAPQAQPASVPGAPLTFTPLLRVGGENLTGTPILLPAPTQHSFGTAVTGSIGSAVTALDGGDAAPSPTAATPLLPTLGGAWMELSVTAPASDTTVVQSPIFDRIGYAVRSAHSAFPVLAAQPDFKTYSAMQTMWNIAVSAGHAATGGGPADLSAGSGVPALSDALARLNTAYFGVRRALVDDALGVNIGVVTAQPGVSLLAFQNSGNLAMDVASDGAVPLTTQEVRPTWAAAAVLAERAVVYSEALLTTGNVGVTTGNDALVEFDRATASGTRVFALHSSDLASPQSSTIPADARARMSAHLAGGASVLALAFAPNVAQTGGPTYAYWIVDPIAGTLRDENEFGRHTEGLEYDETDEDVALKSVCRVNSLANKVANIARIAVLAMGIATLGGQGGSAPAQLAKAVAKTAQAQAESESKRRKMLLNCK